MQSTLLPQFQHRECQVEIIVQHKLPMSSTKCGIIFVHFVKTEDYDALIYAYLDNSFVVDGVRRAHGHPTPDRPHGDRSALSDLWSYTDADSYAHTAVHADRHRSDGCYAAGYRHADGDSGRDGWAVHRDTAACC